MSLALLNEKTDTPAAALAMLQILSKRLENEETSLTTKVLDRETYIATISRANVLREMLQQQEDVCRKAFRR